jgi:peroxiredoxin
MARRSPQATHPHTSRPSADADAPHVIGVYSTDAAHEPETARARRTDRVGGEAVRRAMALGAGGAVVGAVVFGGALLLFASSSAAVVGSGVIGGAVLFGAIGALWGAFSRMGRSEDWREAMPDTPRAADIDLTDRRAGGRATSGEDRRSATTLIERGALAVTDADDEPLAQPKAAEAVTERQTAGATTFAAGSSVGHVLSSEDFVGKVPVTMVFCPLGDATEDLLRRLDEVFPRFGEARVQLLVVLNESSDAVVRRHRSQRLHLPLLADPEGRLALDQGLAGPGQQVRTFVMDREGVVVDALSTDANASAADAILDRTVAAAARRPERFQPHPARRS